jgi:cytochrome b pre-mRNA-processing protein 3
MILPLFRRSREDASIDRLYGAIVAQARLPAFYRDYGVPDTVEGRLEMIMLHALLLLQRLRPEAAAIQAAGQKVFDRFCRDMDDNLREMGVGDLAVPRTMQKIGAAFYGRAKAYETALAGDGTGLVDALQRNIYGPDAAPAGPHRLAEYVRAAATHLRQLDGAALAAGELTFPVPER